MSEIVRKDDTLILERKYALELDFVIGLTAVATLFSTLFFIKNGPIFSLFAIFFGALCVALIVIYNRNKRKHTEEFNYLNETIKNLVKDKYGVEFLKNPLLKTSSDIIIEQGLISANNNLGERIQVSIELTDDKKDILAFSSGTEMKKLVTA